MKQPESYLQRYILSFMISTLLFMLFFIVAQSFSYAGYERNARESALIHSYIAGLESILRNQTCTDTLLFDASSKLDNVGSRIDLLEKRLGKSDPRVLAQKKQYFELEYSHFRIVQRLKKDCGAKFLTLLYFYTQAEEESDANEKASYILNAFKSEDSDHIMVYSFDANIGSGLVQNLRAWYNVTTTPITIIDERTPLALSHIRQLDPYLEEMKKRQ